MTTMKPLPILALCLLSSCIMPGRYRECYGQSNHIWYKDKDSARHRFTNINEDTQHVRVVGTNVVITSTNHPVVTLGSNRMWIITFESTQWHDINENPYCAIDKEYIVKIPTNPPVRWLESPVTVPIYNYHTNGWETEAIVRWRPEPHIRIGLAPDHTVVWRERKDAP